MNKFQHLKAGDKVLTYRHHAFGGSPYTLETVQKVTRTGRIALEGGGVFTPDGRKYGSGHSWEAPSLLEATEENLILYHHARYVNIIHAYVKHIDKLPLETLREFAKVLIAAKESTKDESWV